MFRPMRRARQVLPMEECEAILRRATSGVLSVLGDDGYPYGVPVSYVWHDGAVWFHCAKRGHKLDAIRSCDKVSFCVVAQDEVVPEEYTTYFRSVILFGRAEIVTEPGALRAAMAPLADRYDPSASTERRNGTIEKEMPALCMVKITPEHITGKEAIELVRRRTK